MKYSGVVVIFLLLICCPSLYAEDEEETECFNDEFLMDLVGCFTEKFTTVLSATSQDEETSNPAGRHLLGYHHLTDAVVKQSLDLTLSKLQTKHRDLMKEIDRSVEAVSQKKKKDEIIKTMDEIDFKTLVHEYMDEMLGSVAVIGKQVMSLHQISAYTARRPSTFNETTTASPTDPTTDPTIDPPVCEILHGLLGIDLCRVASCMMSFEEADIEDNLNWLQCFYHCEDIPVISYCVKELFEDKCKHPWFGDIILRGFIDFAKLDDCYFKVISPAEDELPIVLEEGGEPYYVEFMNYVPPGVLCVSFDTLGGVVNLLGLMINHVFGDSSKCVIQIQLSLNNWLYDAIPHMVIQLPIPGMDGITIGQPKCRNGSLLNQAVIGWHEDATDVSCIINVTDANFNKTHRVPIFATVDHKVDGDVTTNFTIKMVSSGSVLKSTKVQVQIKDKDPARPSTCRSINDPHITTFDGHYYNNFYEGYFYLYKQSSLKYEVQVIYQRCTSTTDASCNCAVAVRSGDDVFVVDKCRRKPETCSGDECNMIRTLLYTNGELTNGTRIFSKDNGYRYDVYLPHGTIVKIMLSGELLNVWVTPSNYDFDATTGLCGTFNEDPSDDLTMPDGSIFAGNGSESRGQPREFSEAWRVDEADRIFEGALPMEDQVSINLCKCLYILIEGVQCTCDHSMLMETCDMDTDGELDVYGLNAIRRTSRKQLAAIYKDASFETGLGDIDIDENYSPPDLEWKPDATWNQTSAEEFCEQYIQHRDNPINEECTDAPGLPGSSTDENIEEALWGCQEDIQVTDGTTWALSAQQAASIHCQELIWDRSVSYRDDDMVAIENSTCFNECNERGDCIIGMCDCEEGWWGSGCHIPTGGEVAMVMGDSALCDLRYEDCSYATIYGVNFHENGSLQCRVQEVEIDSEINDVKNGDATVSTAFVSPNQVACELPRAGSYRITLATTAYADLGTVLFMSRDTACYACDPEQHTCWLKDDGTYCLIDEECYAHEQGDSGDECSVCNITVSTNEWTDRPGEYCEEVRADEKAQSDADYIDMVIRLSVGFGLSGLVIIFTILAWCIIKKKEKKKAAEKEEVGGESGDLEKKVEHLYDNVGEPSATLEDDMEGGKVNHAVVLDEKQSSEKKTHEGATGSGDQGEDDVFGATITGGEVQAAHAVHAKADKTRTQQLIDEEYRPRTSSVGSTISMSDIFRVKELKEESERARKRTLSGGEEAAEVRPVKGLGSGAPITYGLSRPGVMDKETKDEHPGIGGHGTGLQVNPHTDLDGLHYIRL